MQSFSQRTLLTLAAVLTMVTIGGNCRGSLAQPALGVSVEDWHRSFDACKELDGPPQPGDQRRRGLCATTRGVVNA
jgi:hypothetical protein